MIRSSRRLADRLAAVEGRTDYDRVRFTLPDGRTLVLTWDTVLKIVGGLAGTVYDANGIQVSEKDFSLLGQATPSERSVLAETVVNAASWQTAGVWPPPLDG